MILDKYVFVRDCCYCWSLYIPAGDILKWYAGRKMVKSEFYNEVILINLAVYIFDLIILLKS